MSHVFKKRQPTDKQNGYFKKFLTEKEASQTERKLFKVWFWKTLLPCVNLLILLSSNDLLGGQVLLP